MKDFLLARVAEICAETPKSAGDKERGERREERRGPSQRRSDTNGHGDSDKQEDNQRQRQRQTSGHKRQIRDRDKQIE